MGFKLRRSTRTSSKQQGSLSSPKSRRSGNSKTKKPEHSLTSTTTSSHVSPPVAFDFPPQELTHIHHGYDDDDVSSIHFGESVSSPEYCYAQPASSPVPPATRHSMKSNSSRSNGKHRHSSLKFIRSDSLARQHEERHSTTSRISDACHVPVATAKSLTSMLYLSLVTFEPKHQDSAKQIVKQSLERHVYTSIQEKGRLGTASASSTRPRRRRPSVPVDVDDCSNVEEEDEEVSSLRRLRRLSVPVDVDDCSNVLDDGEKDGSCESWQEDVVFGLLERRNLPAAIDVYQSILSCNGSYSQQDLSQLYLQLSVLYVLHGDAFKAVWSSELALEKCHSQSDGEQQDQVVALASLGVMLLFAQKPAKALSKFRLALHLQCKLVAGYRHLTIPLLLNNIAACHFCMQEPSDCVSLLQESLHMQRDTRQADLDSLHHMATTLLNLGIASSKLHDYNHATSYTEEGLMVMESILGVDNVYVQCCSDTLEQFVILRAQEGKARTVPLSAPVCMFGNADGVPMRHRSQPVESIALGSLQHELTCEKRVHNAVMGTFRNSLVVAAVTCEREDSSPLKSIPVDLDGSYVVDAELHLQEIHAQVLQSVQQNKVDEALDLLRSTLRSHKNKYGPSHHLVGTALNNLAIVHLHAAQYKDALWNVQEAVNVRVMALGTDHPDVSASMINLGMIQMANGDLDSAYLTLTQVLHARRKAIGYRQPEVAKIVNLIGYIHFESSSLLAALKSTEEALEIQRQCVGCDLDVANTLANLGFLLAKREDYAEAATAMREALALQRRLLSEAHPRTVVTRQNLNHVLSLQSGSIVFQAMDPCMLASFDANCQSLVSSFTWNDDED